MRVFVVYRVESDHARRVLDFLRDLRRQTGHEIDEINPDTREGAEICRVYDIVEYPTIIAANVEGMQQAMWRGLPLPTVSEVGYYASLE